MCVLPVAVTLVIATAIYSSGETSVWTFVGAGRHQGVAPSGSTIACAIIDSMALRERLGDMIRADDIVALLQPSEEA